MVDANTLDDIQNRLNDTNILLAHDTIRIDQIGTVLQQLLVNQAMILYTLHQMNDTVQGG